MTTLLSTQVISKSFGQTKALQRVSVTIEAGKVHTVLGENGSGKSTLVKVLSGILQADSGDIYCGDRVIKPLHPTDMIAHGVSVVLQEVMIAPNMSGYDNVCIGQNPIFSHKRSRAHYKQLVSEWVQKLSDKPIDLQKPAGELSLNEQQILVVARGFMNTPQILILDEITAALDLSDREKVFAEIRTFCQNGGAVIFVSHRMPEIMALSHTVFVMCNGVHTATVQGKDIHPKNLLNLLTQGDGQ